MTEFLIEWGPMRVYGIAVVPVCGAMILYGVLDVWGPQQAPETKDNTPRKYRGGRKSKNGYYREPSSRD